MSDFIGVVGTALNVLLILGIPSVVLLLTVLAGINWCKDE